MAEQEFDARVRLCLSASEVVPVLRWEYGPWVSSLSTEETRAIRKYSYNSYEGGPHKFYRRLNSMLRGEYRGEDVEMLENYSATLSAALTKHPLEHDIICYRRFTGSLQEYYEGREMQYPQFISTSVVKSRTLRGNVEMKIYVPAGTKGAYIEQISIFPRQREFLVDKDVVMRVLCRKENTLEMEVVL